MRIRPFEVEQPSESLYPAARGSFLDLAHIVVQDLRFSKERLFLGRGTGVRSVSGERLVMPRLCQSGITLADDPRM